MSAAQKERAALLNRAYAVLSDITPLRYDCGRLCGAACCKENESHGAGAVCGMLLLPGERELLADGSYAFLPIENRTVAVCDGTCRRDMRPFACRIFPYYPKITRGKNRFSIDLRPDPRAARICPILWETKSRKVQIEFLRAARRAVRILLRDEAIRAELTEQGDGLFEIEQLRDSLRKSARNGGRT